MSAEILQQSSEVRQIARGTVIARENEAGSELFVVLQGEVGVYKNYQRPNELQVATLKAVCYFGENALFLGKPHLATMVAASDVVALALNRQNLGEVFGRRPEVALMIMGDLCKRVDALNQKLGTGPELGYSKGSALFPKAHGNYLLPMDNGDREHLYEQRITCPVCGGEFGSMTVITSKLRLQQTGSDLRPHYKDMEPMYYEVVTCPHCLYSATNDQFPEGTKGMLARVREAVAPYKDSTAINTGQERDTFTVFAGYYLAILCAPCFDNHQMITARLWLRLSRLYHDCEDQTMYLFAAEQALNDYRYAYEHFYLTEKIMQQICYIMGDLYLRLEDLNEARNFFFLAKSNRAGTRNMSRQADIRLDEIRELIQKRKEQESAGQPSG